MSYFARMREQYDREHERKPENNMKNIEIAGVDPADHPDYADAYIAYAERLDGTPLTDDELDTINDNHPEIAQSMAFESLL